MVEWFILKIGSILIGPTSQNILSTIQIYTELYYSIYREMTSY